MSTPHRPFARLAATVTATLGLALGSVLLVAPTSAQAAPTATPPGGAWVRTGHFVPGMDKADVVLTPADPRGSVAPIEDLAYSDVTDYVKLAPGRYTASVSSSAADPDAEPLLSSSFEVTAGDARTVAVVGTPDAPRLTLLTDDLTPPAADTARVRLLSASEKADAVTVRALMGPTVADGAVLGQATAYKTVPAGPWTLALMDNAADSTKQQVDIASGSVYTVVVVDSPGGGVELDVVTDAAGAAVAPQGGADTGLGGAAGAAAPVDGSGTPAGPAGLLALVALAAAAGLGLRRLGRSKVAGVRP